MKEKIMAFIRFSRRVHLKSRLLALALALVLAFYMIPTVIFAEVGEAISSAMESGSEAAEGGSDVGFGDSYRYNTDLYEVVEQREESVKHFHLPDGTYLAAQYPYPVHITDDSGKLVDIDNTLTEDEGGFGNKSARIKFAKKITGNETLFTLSENNTKITLSLIGAKKGVVGVATNGTDAEEDTELGKKLNLENLTSSVLYADILPSVDLEYVVQSLNIKENIIVKERSDSYSYAFEVKLNNLTAELSESGDVHILDNGGNIKYIIPAPVVYDADGAIAPSDKAYYTLTQSGKKYTLTVTVDPTWMNAVERAFPVTVDPSLTVYGTSNIIDTYIDSNNQTTINGAEIANVVSSSCTTYIKALSLPVVPLTAHISKITLSVSLRSLTGTGYIGAYVVLTDWSDTLTWENFSNSLDPSGAVGNIVQEYCYISSTGLKTFDITACGKRWYSGYNFGVALKKISGTSDFSANIHSTDALLGKPVITVSYVDMGGVESYMPLTSHSAGLAGEGNINLANGQLNLSIPLITTTDSLMPITVGLVYNSALSGKEYVYGNVNSALSTSYTPLGFMLNIGQTVIQKKYTDTKNRIISYYLYIDGDGTEHAFYVSSSNNSVYVDDGGLQMKLTVGDGSLSITDSSFNTYTFIKKSVPESGITTAWILTKIQDEYGNAVSITFSENKPTKVSLIPAGGIEIEMLNMHYNSSGKLDAIYNLVSGDAAILRYSSTYSGEISATNTKYLRRVDYAHGTSAVTATGWANYAASSINSTNITRNAYATYSYTSSSNEYRLYEILDGLSLQRMRYTWSNKKLAYIYHFGNATQGQRIGMTYSTGYTDVQSSGNDDIYGTADDIKTRHILDARGRVVSTYSFGDRETNLYGATVGEYESEENAKNSLKTRTVLGNSSPNYILNGRFEDRTSTTSALFWQTTGTVNYSDNYAKLTPGAGTVAGIYQYVRLEPGDYTISFTVESRNGSQAEGSIVINAFNNTAAGYIEAFPLEVCALETDNLAVSVASATFTVPEGTENWAIYIQASGIVGMTLTPEIRISDVMLSKSVGVSEYNHISLGDFSLTGIDGNGISTAALSDYWSTHTGGVPAMVTDSNALFGSSAKVSAVQYGTSYIKQRIFEATVSELTAMNTTGKTNAGRTYKVSGYGKSTDALLSSTGIFRLRADVYYYQPADGTDVIKSYYFDFVPDCRTWQYTGGSFSTEYIDFSGEDTNNYSLVRAIDIVCEYSNQVTGYALFDKISVLETSAGRTYCTYYQDGKLRTRTQNNYTEYYAYNTDGRIARCADTNGALLHYHYDSSASYMLTYILEYEFDTADGYSYFDYVTNIESEIIETPAMYYGKMHDRYGLLLDDSISIPIDWNGSFASANNEIWDYYEYNYDEKPYIFGTVKEHGSSYGEVTKYFYDETNGRLLAAVETNGKTGYAYTYDEMGALVSVKPANYNLLFMSYFTESNTENATYTYNSKKQLSAITTGSTTYTFTYDVYGNTTSVKAGSNTLAQYSYNANNGKLCKITYGNGFSEEYVYNSLEQLIEIWYTYSDGTKEIAYSYEYTADGQVYRLTGHLDGKYTIYKYGYNGKLVGMAHYNNSTMEHTVSLVCGYDDNDNLDYANYNIAFYEGTTVYSTSVKTDYTVDIDGVLLSELISAEKKKANLEYSYDAHNRITDSSLKVYNLNENMSVSTPSLSIDYSYSYELRSQIGNHSVTNYNVSSFTSTVGSATTTASYVYDIVGNITKITYGDGKVIEYTYDNLNQLLREDNGVVGYTYTYTYDDAGNILSQQKYALTYEDNISTAALDTEAFVYSTTGWGDMLTSYDGAAVTYDAIGNMTSFRKTIPYTLTWEGRQLKQLSRNNRDFRFEYNDEGYITSRTMNWANLIEYYYSGSLLIAEKTSAGISVYFYDAAGSPIGMQYHAYSYADGVWDTYYYEKNLQGDVVAVYSADGTKLVSYKYDAWGNFTVTINDSTYGSAANSHSPFRYRGYYYDSALSLYRLGTRFYCPEMGRFISPDGIGYLGANGGLNSYNLYAYCSNNPVMYTDPSGHFVITFSTLFIGMLVGAGVGAGISFGATVYQDYADDGQIFNGSIGFDEYAGNTLGGFIAGAGVGACTILGAAAGTAVLAGTSATLFATGGIGVTMGTALAIGSGTAFATGMLGYAVKTAFNTKESFDLGTMFMEGGFNALSGMVSVFGGYVGGICGLRTDVSTKLLFKKTDIALRIVAENIFTGGVKIGMALFKGAFQ